jgi:DNA-binding MarR family transcriptional regulator
MNLNKNYLRQNLNSSNKKLNEQIMILKLIAKSKTPLTIPEISEKLLLSVPTITSSVSDLIEDRWVTIGGKKENIAGEKTYNVQS